MNSIAQPYDWIGSMKHILWHFEWNIALQDMKCTLLPHVKTEMEYFTVPLSFMMMLNFRAYSYGLHSTFI